MIIEQVDAEWAKSEFAKVLGQDVVVQCQTTGEVILVSGEWGCFKVKQLDNQCGVLLFHGFYVYPSGALGKARKATWAVMLRFVYRIARTGGYSQVLATSNGDQSNLNAGFRAAGYDKVRECRNRRTGNTIRAWFCRVGR